MNPEDVQPYDIISVQFVVQHRVDDTTDYSGTVRGLTYDHGGWPLTLRREVLEVATLVERPTVVTVPLGWEFFYNEARKQPPVTVTLEDAVLRHEELQLRRDELQRVLDEIERAIDEAVL